MDVIPSGGVYALMLLFGAVAVTVHAYELYGQPLDDRAVPHGSVLLEGLPLSTLVGTRAFNRGFLCYLAIDQFLYLVLCFSSVILELSLSVVDLRQSIGALEQGGSSVNPLTPIVASSIIVTGSRARPLAQIEKAIRRLAHRVAGLPDGLYALTTRINDFGFALPAAELEGATPSVRDAHRLAERVVARARAALPEGDAKALGDDLRRVYTLRAWTIGPDGDGVWDERSRAGLRDTLVGARAEFLRVDERLAGSAAVASAADAGSPLADIAARAGEIGGPRVVGGGAATAIIGGGAGPRDVEAAFAGIAPLVTAPPPTRTAGGADASDEANAWRALATDVERLQGDLAVLFALLVTNQSQVRMPEGSGRLRNLIGHVRRREPAPESDALFGSVLAGLFVGFLLAALYYAIERPIADSAALAELDAAKASTVSEHVMSETRVGRDGPGLERALVTNVDEGAVLERAVDTSGGAFALLSDGLRRALGSVLPLGIVFAVSAATALGLRAASESAMQWTRWHADAEGLPVRQYVSVALTSTLMAFLFYTLYVFTRLVVAPSLVLEGTWLSPSLLRDFADFFPTLAPLPLIGIVCATAVCRVADAGSAPAHAADGGSPTRRSLTFAALCGLVGVVGRLLAGPVDARAALEALLVPLLTLWPCFHAFALLYARRAPGRGA